MTVKAWIMSLVGGAGITLVAAGSQFGWPTWTEYAGAVVAGVAFHRVGYWSGRAAARDEIARMLGQATVERLENDGTWTEL